jgi:hypothetical protein
MISGLIEIASPVMLRANGSREMRARCREALQGRKQELDCFVARAPRNDGANVSTNLSTSLRAKRSNPAQRFNAVELDCLVAGASRNDGASDPVRLL